MFRHNAWATRRLIAFCAALPEVDLTSTTPASYGGIAATFRHIVVSDAHYLRSLSGSAPAWLDEPVDTGDLAVLDGYAGEVARMWETFLADGIDGGRTLVLDRGTYLVNAGVVVAQAVHHGNAHREQVCAILTSQGFEVPDIQPWGFADDTGRSRSASPEGEIAERP